MMYQQHNKQQSKSDNTHSRDEASQDMLRILSMVKKAVGRLVRRTYSDRSRYPELFFHIEEVITRLRDWIQRYRLFAGSPAFQVVLCDQVNALRQAIAQVQEQCQPPVKQGNRRTSRAWQTYRKLCQRLEQMLGHLEHLRSPLGFTRNSLERACETALRTALERIQRGAHDQSVSRTGASRGEHTIVFPWAQPEGYVEVVSDRQRFRQEVVVPLETSPHVTGHHEDCQGPKHYTLIGFRPHPRKIRLIGGQQAEFPIRMVRCTTCGARLSVLPSFLAREKHFALDLIGHVVKKLTLCGQSVRATLEDLAILCPGRHSPQTPLDWLTWVGTLHPAALLTRAGIQGTGYFQEDEGFEKEPGLQTYTIAMVEPTTLLVWHLDYVDHVDEDTLYTSFDQFVKHITVHVLGVTKDTWQPSTKALKRVCHALWIAFCHRHELKKWRQALSIYQKETHCHTTECQRLYRAVKTVMEAAESGSMLRLKLHVLAREEAAFQHPLLHARLEELAANAVHYTSHHKRHGLTRTTSIVDNFLKIVKRKLRQVESFRDPESTRLFFRAMANVRNFVPFLSGAKNAHKSPFMLAQGNTYDLPWIQVMNMHNAFLFTAEAC